MRGSIRRDPWRLAAVTAAVLLGAGIGAVITGLEQSFHRIFAAYEPGDGLVFHGVAALSLVALAAGVRVPQQFALWGASWARGRLAGRKEPPSAPVDWWRPTPADHSLYWIVQAGLTLGAGVLVALLPFGLNMAALFYEWMQRHFLWSESTATVLQTLVVLVTVMVPLGVSGLCISACRHLQGKDDLGETSAGGWLLIGAAAAVGLAPRLNGAYADTLIVRLGALSILLVSVLSAAASTRTDSQNLDRTGAKESGLPQYSDRRPRLLRTSIVIVAAAATLLMAATISGVALGGEAVPLDAAATLLVIGASVVVTCTVNGDRTIGGFGMTCVAAGFAAAVLASAWPTTPSGAAPADFVLVAAALSAFGVSYVYGRQTLVRRVSGRSFVGAKVLARSLLAAGLTAGFVGPPILARLGPRGTTLLVSLVLLALGGLLVIHEPGYSPLRRRVRLGVVFSAVAGLILVHA